MKFDHVFERVEIESEYLKNILNDTLERISRYIDLEKLNLGPIKEMPTFSGEVAEVTENGWIVINSKQLQELEHRVAMAIIAHEIAHSYLEHYLDMMSDDGGLQNEKEADDQARKWGFDVDCFRKVLGPPHSTEKLNNP
jgi:Zn-finger domain-containing protein